MASERYYSSTFFWSTVAKVLNSLIGFVAVPLLLGYFGKAQYGVLALATACNGYMHLLDLGMDTGAVKFYSVWRSAGETDKVYRAAHSNITFYLCIAVLNALMLVALAVFGEPVFSLSHDEFLQLRGALFILAAFSVFNWGTTVYNQLLISAEQMQFTMKMNCVQALLRGSTIALTLALRLSLLEYFLILTASVAILILPVAIRARRQKLIDGFKPGWDWAVFRPVLFFSLSIFALSLFQVTATQSRAIVLGIIADKGAETVTDFNIISVIPSLIISIGLSFSAIFLPRTAPLVESGDKSAVENFAYRWTGYTSIIACILTFPFILCAREVLEAYVGAEYSGLAIWMDIWCITALIQIHTTPGNSLIIAYGRMRELVVTTAAACVLSIVVNALLCKSLGAGSAVVGYFLYVVIIIGLYYFHYYRKLLHLSGGRMLLRFLAPTVVAAASLIAVALIPISGNLFPGLGNRFSLVVVCILKSTLWLFIFLLLSFATRILKKDDIKRIFHG